MRGLFQDIRFTFRNAGRAPAVSAIIVVSLALGIGANTAIFSLFHGLLLRPLPVARPGELVLLYWGAAGSISGMSQSSDGAPPDTRWATASRSVSYPFFRRVVDRLPESFFAFAPLGTAAENTTLVDDARADRVDAEMISGGYFRVLGVSPAAGRAITAEDERAGARVAVLSHAYWSRRFRNDAGVLGRAITLNDVQFEVVGVAAKGFSGVQPGRMPDVWIPLMDAPGLTPWGARPDTSSASLLTRHDYWWVRVMGRVAERDRGQAAAVLDADLRQYVRDHVSGSYPPAEPHVGFERAATGLDVLRSTYERPLKLLMGVMAAVLVVACANVAVLLLSQAVSRRREIALRLSLGATRARIVRQLLTESLLLALAGASVGILFAAWTTRGLLMLVPAHRRPLLDTPVDATVLLFTVAVAAVTALLFGLAPALLARGADVLPALKSISGGTASEPPAHRAWSSTFVVVQVAASLVLVLGAGLFVRSLANLRGEPLGLHPGQVLVFTADASQIGYAGERLVQVYIDVLRAIGRTPGAEAATAVRLRLFSGSLSLSPVTAAGARTEAARTGMQWNAVGPEFAKTLGMSLRTGRDLTWEDIEGRRRVALINEAMARHLFGDFSALGRRFNFGDRANTAAEYEIVGVVANAKYSRVRGEFPRVAYVPFSSMPPATLRGLTFQVRTGGEPLALGPAVREAVQGVDNRLAVVDLASMPAQIDDSLWLERLFARLTSAFGAAALLLACIGIYGTISYSVRRRQREIAVRIALGAQRAQVLLMVLRRGILLAIWGILAGVPLTVWAGRYIASMLFGVQPSDPPTIAAAAGVLLVVACAAAYLPARRATLVDPSAALKQEG